MYQTSGTIEGEKFAPAIQEARRYSEQYIEFTFNREVAYTGNTT